MEHTPEAYRNAPEEPDLTPEEKRIVDVLNALREKVGLKDGDAPNLDHVARGLFTKEFYTLAFNNSTLENAREKSRQTKPGLLLLAHSEATELNKEFDALIAEAEQAKAALENAESDYTLAVEAVAKFQKEKLQ
jgi:hypothetical protein